MLLYVDRASIACTCGKLASLLIYYDSQFVWFSVANGCTVVSELFTTEKYNETVQWPLTVLNTPAVIACPCPMNNNTGQRARRQCLPNGEWGESDFGNCLGTTFIRLCNVSANI